MECWTLKRWGIAGWAGALSLWLLAATAAFACQCLGDQPLEERLAAAHAVFAGRPREVWLRSVQGSGMDYPVQYLQVVFQVDAAWKGVGENVVSVLTPLSDAACGYYPAHFDPGTRYLIFASDSAFLPSFGDLPPDVLSGQARPLWTAACAGNAVLDGRLAGGSGVAIPVHFRSPEAGAADLKLLGAGTRPPPSGDVDRDGRLSLGDVQLALQAAVGAAVLSAGQQIAGDLNADGRLDMQDVVLLLRRAVGP